MRRVRAAVGSSHFAGVKRCFPSVRTPACGAARPASTSSSSLCPLPETPATPTISPAFSVRETSCRRGTPCASLRQMPCACSSHAPVCPGATAAAADSRPRFTCLPTMACASTSSVTSPISRSSTTCPARITVTASHSASTSLSLCVISRTVVPCARNCLKVPNRACVSCGVSTAVGSSRIRMRAPRYSVFRISRRWRSPTGRRDTGASSCTCSPVSPISVSSRVRA